MFKEWSKGNRIVFDGQPRLLGRQGQDPEPRAPLERRGRPRWLELQSGTVDGIDNPGTDDIEEDPGRDSTLKFYPRAGLNTFYLGFNNTDKPFDNVRGPPGDRHGHRP